MAERYSRLFSLKENLYSEGSPVVIAAGALLKDNQTGKELEGVSEYQYLDLNEARDAEFGQKQAITTPWG